MQTSPDSCQALHLILLGAPGAGKGTLAAFLRDHWNQRHISSGDILRVEVREATPLGMEAKGYMDRGELVPDNLIILMMEEQLKRLGATTGYVLDGFPRTVAQAEALDQMLLRIGHSLDAVVNLEVPEWELIRRLTGRRVCPNCGAVYHVDTMKPQREGICDRCDGPLEQRKDDQLDAITNRLKVYTAQTEPLIAYYRACGKLLVVDGMIGMSQVAEEIHKAVCRVGG